MLEFLANTKETRYIQRNYTEEEVEKALEDGKKTKDSIEKQMIEANRYLETIRSRMDSQEEVVKLLQRDFDKIYVEHKEKIDAYLDSMIVTRDDLDIGQRLLKEL